MSAVMSSKWRRNKLPSRFPFSNQANFGDFTSLFVCLIFCARMPAKQCSKFKNARAKLSFRQLVLLHRHVLVARRRRGPLPCHRVIIPMTLTKMSMRAHARRRGVLSSTGVFKVVVVVAVFTVSI